jgi:hypothetical protein
MTDFDPIASAKSVVGVLQAETQTSFSDALLLQAGLRILLPSESRVGVAAPKVFPNDPELLQAAQTVVIDMLLSGRDPTQTEIDLAHTAISEAVGNMGNAPLADAITAWQDADKAGPQRPTTSPGPAPNA